MKKTVTKLTFFSLLCTLIYPMVTTAMEKMEQTTFTKESIGNFFKKTLNWEDYDGEQQKKIFAHLFQEVDNKIEKNNPDALQYAVEKGSSEIAQFLSEKKIKVEPTHMLKSAIENKSLEAVTFLLERNIGMKPNKAPEYIIKQSALPIINFLLENNLKADPRKALTCAIKTGSLEIVTFLLENRIVKPHLTHIWNEVKSGNMETANLLMSTLVVSNKKNSTGNTTLHSVIERAELKGALTKEYINFTQLIVLKSAHIINEVNNDGKTVLDIAKQHLAKKGWDNIVQILKKNGAQTSTAVNSTTKKLPYASLKRTNAYNPMTNIFLQLNVNNNTQINVKPNSTPVDSLKKHFKKLGMLELQDKK